VDFTAGELDTLLAWLFVLLLTHQDAAERGTIIDSLVWRLGGDPDAPMFGATDYA